MKTVKPFVQSVKSMVYQEYLRLESKEPLYTKQTELVILFQTLSVMQVDPTNLCSSQKIGLNRELCLVNTPSLVSSHDIT